MSLRFFADHCVPGSIIEDLRNGGHEVFILKEYLPTNADDSIVITEAQTQNAILLSLNGDFSDITTYPPSNFNGIIALQVRNHPEVLPSLMHRLVNDLSKNPQMSHYKGRLFLVQAHRIRMRK